MTDQAKKSPLGGPLAGVGLEAFAPMVLLGIRKADVQELAGEVAEALAPYLKKPDDRARVATLLEEIARRLGPARLELVKPEQPRG